MPFCNPQEASDIHTGAVNASDDERSPPGKSFTGAPLTPQQFAQRYEEARRTLWYIAAAILGDRTLAHDVVQEAAAIAMGKLTDFDPSTNFTAWMGQIVRFVALNEARGRQRRRTVLASPETFASGAVQGNPHPSSTSTVAGDAAAADTDIEGFDERVRAALLSLDETARACLVLRVVHGMAYSEISKALSIPEGTAMSHVHRSRLALRERLRGHADALLGRHPSAEGGEA
jgi:RNA polymerase sigma-70 factor (ECF subfamily)